MRALLYSVLCFVYQFTSGHPDVSMNNKVHKEVPTAKILDSVNNCNIADALTLIAEVIKGNQRNTQLEERLAILENEISKMEKVKFSIESKVNEVFEKVLSFEESHLFVANLTTRMKNLEFEAKEKFHNFETKLTFLAGEVIRLKNSKMEFSRKIFAKDSSQKLSICTQNTKENHLTLGHCLRKARDAESWQDANEMCQQMNGVLSSLQDLVNSTVQKIDGNVWISVADMNSFAKVEEKIEPTPGKVNQRDVLRSMEKTDDLTQNAFDLVSNDVTEYGNINLLEHYLTEEDSDNRLRRSIEDHREENSVLKGLKEGMNLSNYLKPQIDNPAMSSSSTSRSTSPKNKPDSPKMVFKMLESISPEGSPSSPNKFLDCPSLKCSEDGCVVVLRVCSDNLAFWCTVRS